MIITVTDLLSNELAQQHFLDRHRLRFPPLSTTPQSVMRHLNFMQVDSIDTMARAHNLILWSRQQSYRPTDLRKMVDIDRSAFEGWTHDASILPLVAFPHWRHKSTRDRALLQKLWKSCHRGDFLKQTQTVLDQIASQGPVGLDDVGTEEKRDSGGWWDWHPLKTALKYIWRTGRIAVTRREGFRAANIIAGYIGVMIALAGLAMPPQNPVERLQSQFGLNRHQRLIIG